MRKVIGLAPLVLLAAGCVSTQDRPMNFGEKTYVSDDVREIVANSESGSVDTREYSNIRCRRYKLVGTHMVTRYCYTSEEEEEMAKNSQDKMRDRFGKQSCLDRTLGSICSNASPQDPFAGLAGRNPN